jgi:hypothetical protein
VNGYQSKTALVWGREIFCGEKERVKIIVLNGNTSSGKTTTMSMVYATLISNGAAKEEFNVIQNTEPTEDFETLLFYKGKRVAICSHGDIPGNYNTAVKTYSAKADVLIIADSTGSPMAQPPFIILSKTPFNGSEVQANATDCHKIISLI